MSPRLVELDGQSHRPGLANPDHSHLAHEHDFPSTASRRTTSPHEQQIERVASLSRYYHPSSSIYYHYQATRQQAKRPANRIMQHTHAHTQTRTRIIGTPHIYTHIWFIIVTGKRKTTSRKDSIREDEREREGRQKDWQQVICEMINLQNKTYAVEDGRSVLILRPSLLMMSAHFHVFVVAFVLLLYFDS
jgi:hypothetical protein